MGFHTTVPLSLVLQLVYTSSFQLSVRKAQNGFKNCHYSLLISWQENTESREFSTWKKNHQCNNIILVPRRGNVNFKIGQLVSCMEPKRFVRNLDLLGRRSIAICCDQMHIRLK